MNCVLKLPIPTKAKSCWNSAVNSPCRYALPCVMRGCWRTMKRRSVRLCMYSLLHQAVAIPVTHTATIIRRSIWAFRAWNFRQMRRVVPRSNWKRHFMCLFPRMSGMNAWRTGCGRWIWALAQAAGPTNWWSATCGFIPSTTARWRKVWWIPGRWRGCGKTVSNSVRHAAISPGWYAIWLKNRRKLRH